jgi:hypothetical protein
MAVVRAVSAGQPQVVGLFDSANRLCLPDGSPDGKVDAIAPLVAEPV